MGELASQDFVRTVGSKSKMRIIRVKILRTYSCFRYWEAGRVGDLEKTLQSLSGATVSYDKLQTAVFEFCLRLTADFDILSAFSERRVGVNEATTVHNCWRKWKR